MATPKCMIWTLISGTNRADSQSIKVTKFTANYLKDKLGPSEDIQVLDLAKLPAEMFNPEVYSEKPSSFDPFRERMLKSQAIISVLPEYNGSAPGAFKYFIDMLPFPESLARVPCAFIGISAGRFGSVRSVEHMQDVFQYRHAFLYPERLFISNVSGATDDSGKPTDDFVFGLFEAMMEGFADFAKRLRST